MLGSRSSLILGVCLILGLAVFGYQFGRAVKRGREFDRYLTVKGLSEREVKATVGIWPLRFAVYAEELGALKNAMERDRKLVVSFLTENGVAAEEITQGVPAVNDRQDERIQSNKPNLQRYRGLSTLVVRTPNVDVLKKALSQTDLLLERGVALAGSEYESRAEFLFGGVNEVKPAMIQEATASARAAAEKFAQDSGSKVGRIRKATQGALEITDRDAAAPEFKVLRVVTTIEFFLD